MMRKVRSSEAVEQFRLVVEASITHDPLPPCRATRRNSCNCFKT
jgi:hypothetical protein